MKTITEERKQVITNALVGVGEAQLNLDVMSIEVAEFYDKKTRKFDKEGFKAMLVNEGWLDTILNDLRISRDTLYTYSRLAFIEGSAWRTLGVGRAVALESTAKEVGVDKFNKALEQVDLAKKVDLGNADERLEFVNSVREVLGLDKKRARKSNGASSRSHELTKEEYRELNVHLAEVIRDIHIGADDKMKRHIESLVQSRGLAEIVGLGK